jgi:hypothetical protein
MLAIAVAALAGGCTLPAAMLRAPAGTAGRTAPRRPAMVRDLIPYPAARREEMAAYSLRHYGVASWRLRPRLIVLHFTATGSYDAVRSTFAADRPNKGELPGVCSHYVVDQDGTIHELVPPWIRCRHAIGVNDRAVGIEMVQEAGPGATWADRQILARRPQIRSALRLVAWLEARYSIADRNVIGHAMVNDSPFFHDLEGWTNDHTDWQPPDVAVFRSRLAARR